MEAEDEIKKIKDSMKNKATTNMLAEMRKDIEIKVDEVLKEIDKKNTEKNEKIEELHHELKLIKENIDEIRDFQRKIEDSVAMLRNYAFKYEKMNKRLKSVEEVIGVEEEINVNKIPPSILRLVYQYTLNDAINELRKSVGVDEATRMMKEVLLDVRTKTSGTELFKLIEGRIEAKDIEKAVEKKLISPKQIHLTYLEIIKKIRDYLPSYIPKNFASLLRTKGQEYSIETSTENNLRIAMGERQIESLRNKIAVQENTLREDISDTKKAIEQKIKDKADEMNSRIEKLFHDVKKLNNELIKIHDDIGKTSPYINEFITSLYQKMEQEIPRDGMKKREIHYPKQIVEDFINIGIKRGNLIVKEDMLYSTKHVENKIINTLGEEYISFSELKRKTGYDKDILVTVLEWLKKRNVIQEKKSGKGKKYKRR